MAKLALQQFKGIIPKTPPKLLGNSNAQIATNCRLDRGHLEPWYDLFWVVYHHNLVDANGDNVIDANGEQIETPRYSVGDPTDDVHTIYLFNDDFWFHWLQDVDVVKAPITNDAEEKTLFTVNDGDTTKPKITDASVATAGEDPPAYPTNYYNVGVPSPVNALTASNSPSCAEADQESVAYIYTYVNEYGFEGPPSPPSSVIDRCEGDSVDLSNMDVGPDGNYKVGEWLKRVYRAVSGTESTDYQFVMNVNIASSSATDAYNTDELGEIIPSMDWTPPPDDLRGVTALPNGIVAGFSGKDLYFCEPYMPHAWPRKYSLATDEPIVGLGAFGTSLVVCTDGTPYLVTGSHSENMSMSYLGVHQACRSKKGIVSLGPHGVLYPSPDGLVMVTSKGAEVLTTPVLTRDQWQKDYVPESIVGVGYNTLYFGFYNNGTSKAGFILNPFDIENGFMPLDIHANAGFRDLLKDELYLMVDRDNSGIYDEIVKWQGSDEKLAFKWKTKKFTIPNMNFNCAQVVAESYNDLVFKIYGDDQIIFTKNVTDDKVFRLPGGSKNREFEIELTGTDIVNELYVATSITELHSLG